MIYGQRSPGKECQRGGSAPEGYASRTLLIHNRKVGVRMEVVEILDEVKKMAKRDEKVRQELLATRQAENPVSAFCTKVRKMGYPLYDMDLILAGEEFYALIKRSTNGGGENSPALEGEDDFYGLFLAELE